MWGGMLPGLLGPPESLASSLEVLEELEELEELEPPESPGPVATAPLLRRENRGASAGEGRFCLVGRPTAVREKGPQNSAAACDRCIAAASAAAASGASIPRARRTARASQSHVSSARRSGTPAVNDMFPAVLPSDAPFFVVAPIEPPAAELPAMVPAALPFDSTPVPPAAPA